LSAWTAAVLTRTLPWRRLDSEVLALGEVFRGRLRDDLLDDALEYVAFNERLLAVEFLADHLGEYDARLTREEWERLIRVYESSGGDPTASNRFAFLEPMPESTAPPP
jgi:hypothetical protein